jgi:glycosyltransferase involved in cell wall biosynthesis
LSTTEEIAVSVVMIIYNHENFLEEAIRGVITQKTNFRYELVLANDKSTDNSHEICQKYADEFPDKIVYLNHPENLGMIKNFCSAVRASKGKYLAICEGDDFWINVNKLQIQYDLMEKHPDAGICFHPVSIIDEARTVINSKTNPGTSSVQNVEYLWRQNYIYTCSSFLINSFKTKIPFENEKVISGDWTMFFSTLLTENSRNKIYYIDEVMATYRKHEGGVWSKHNDYRKLEIHAESTELIRSYLRREFAYSDAEPEMKRVLARLYFDLACLSLEQKHYLNYFRYFLKTIPLIKFNRDLKLANMLGTLKYLLPKKKLTQNSIV